jgi:hypothetical protein
MIGVSLSPEKESQSVKGLTILTTSVLLVVAAGCNTPEPSLQDRSRLNAWLLASVRDTAINQAIILQGAVHPYHFVSGAAVLNDLGKHDLNVLAAHYRKHPAALSIRRGEAALDLYEARVATVVKTLTRAGVEKGRMTISDTRPGGEGMTSERVLSVLENERDQGSLLPSGGSRQSVQTGVSR